MVLQKNARDAPVLNRITERFHQSKSETGVVACGTLLFDCSPDLVRVVEQATEVVIHLIDVETRRGKQVDQSARDIKILSLKSVPLTVAKCDEADG